MKDKYLVDLFSDKEQVANNDNKEQLTSKEKHLKCIEKLTGDNHKMISHYIDYLESDKGRNFIKTRNHQNLMIDLIKKNNSTFTGFIDSNLKDIFNTLYPKEFADLYVEATKVMSKCIYSESYYRRSHRSNDISLYTERIKNIFFMLLIKDIDKLNIYEYITKGIEDILDFFYKNDVQAHNRYHSRQEIQTQLIFFIAASINLGDEQIIDLMKDIMQSDNNTISLNYTLIKAIVASDNAQLHDMLIKLTLAAKLQEGFRQSIFENADFGSKDFLIKLIKVTIDEDLLRFSSVLRAVCTWMGLTFDYSDKRIVAKYLEYINIYFDDEKELKKALDSKDIVEMYSAMWVETFDEVEKTIEYAEKFMQGEKYQKVIALKFLSQIENNDFKTNFAAKYLKQDDMDVFAYVFNNYNLNIGYSYYYADAAVQKNCRKDFVKSSRSNKILEDEGFRKQQFDILEEVIYKTPVKNGYTSTYTVQGDEAPSFKREGLFSLLVTIACYDLTDDYTARLINITKENKVANQDILLINVVDIENSELEREFVIESLTGSMDSKEPALDLLKSVKMTEKEIEKVERLFNLKTSSIREAALKIIIDQDIDIIIGSIEKSFKLKNEMRRIAGLDLLLEIYREEKIDTEQVNKLLDIMENKTEREIALITNILKIGNKEQIISEKYNIKNGFGFYDVDWKPEIFDIVKSDKNILKEFNDFKAEDIVEIIDSLYNVVLENIGTKYTLVDYDGQTSERVLGEYDYFNIANYNAEGIEAYPLPDVWKKWIKDIKLDYLTYYRVWFAKEVMNFDNIESAEPWYQEFIKKLFNIKEFKRVSNYFYNLSKIEKKKEEKNLPEYKNLMYRLFEVMEVMFDNEEKQSTLHHISLELYDLITKEGVWNDKFRDNMVYDYKIREDVPVPQKIMKSPLINKFFNKWIGSVEDEEYSQHIKMILNMNQFSNYTNLYCDYNYTARGIINGFLPESEIYRRFVNYNEFRYNDFIDNETPEEDLVGKHLKIFNQRILDIEVTRVETDTDASKYVFRIYQNYGVENFVKILIALGDDVFTRGYSYSGGKKDSLSHLLSVNIPNKDDNAEMLRKLIDNRIPDKRLLEAAMYVPKWVDIIDDYLGWKGLKSGVWYFHAHTTESFRAEYETEFAKFSPISSRNFMDGAFDIDWFNQVYNNLGKKRFDELYDSAKYISSGGAHKRAQRFSDAVLGKLNKKQLAEEISDKRNKDKLLSYSLIPFEKNKMKDALKRYEFIQKFLTESKKFGSMRQASEKKVCEIAIDNLARNLGFQDTLRFSWKMEVMKIETIQKYFEPKKIDDAEFYFKIDESGVGEIITVKNGKVLKNIPVKQRKNKYIEELKELKKNLKDQFRRARASFEVSMEIKDRFAFEEILDLFNHPVIKQIVNKIVFKGDNGIGFLSNNGLVSADGKEIKLDKKDNLIVAHPVDLLASGKWSDFQKYLFENQIVQPFKQVFRELYILNDDEKKEKTLSRRYAGHQVQPRKTVALLKARGWTVDYYEGLQKVYYKENLIVHMYAMADWFSPSDVEAPTLETINFYDRVTGKTVLLKDIDPILFSEVMRDIDLVISIAHVGGVDPEASHSTIEMRGMIVTETLKLMKIENAKIDKNHVHINGHYGDYTIHLGSGIVHKMGTGALNILPVHSQHRGKLFIPFLDEDPRTAEIVSKVYFLANDTKIKDPMILEQIK